MIPEVLEPARIVLAGAWGSLMLIYLLGDVLRLFAGDIEPGRIDGSAVGGGTWTIAALIMLVPIAMVLGSLLIPAGPLMWLTIVLAAALILFNLVGMPYPGLYDNVLLVISFGVNLFTVWIVWSWQHPGS